MRKAWRILSGGLALALVVYFIYYATRALDVALLRKALASPAVATWVLIAALLYAMIVPITAWAWQKLLAVQAEHHRVANLSLILGFSQLAKYVPGNVAQHAARAAMSLRAGIRAGPFVVTIAQEILLAVAASLIVGVTALAFSGHGLSQISPNMGKGLSAIGFALLVLVAVLASVRLDPAVLATKDGAGWRLLARLGGLPGPFVTLSAVCAYSLNYLLIGAGLWFVAHAMGIGDILGFFLVTSVFSLSWVLGFLAPGAPAGIGAREGIMLLLLHGSAGNDELLVFVVLARIVTMLGDAFCFLGASIGRFLTKRVEDSNG